MSLKDGDVALISLLSSPLMEARSGIASRYVRVRAFCASLHACTFGSFQSSNQRYGSAIFMPWMVSAVLPVCVAGGGGMLAASAAPTASTLRLRTEIARNFIG